MISDFKFAVLGDSRGTTNHAIQINKAVLGKLLYNIKNYHDPNFILFGGDMILGRTTPNVNPTTSFIYVNLLEWKRFVEKSLGVNTLRGYLYPAIGNHDYSNAEKLEGRLEAFNRVFSYLPSGPCDEEMLKRYGKTVYYFDYRNSRFIVLNTVFKNAASTESGKTQDLVGITPEQLKWLEKVLSTSKKDNNFVMFHCPVIGTWLEYYTLPYDQQEALFRIFNKYSVVAVYCGHEHNYNRRFISNVFYKEDYALSKSIIQVTSGGAGAPLEKAGPERINIVNGPVSIFEYAIVEVFDTIVKTAVYDINGICIDSFISY